jgi:hypothetical protein
MSARDKLTGWLKERKDSSVSFLVEKVLQKRLEGYGRLLAFDLNSREQTACVKMLPTGEVEPVTINVEQYVLSMEPGGVFLTLKQASTSRPWLTKLLDEFVVNQPFPVPEKYGNVIKLLL